MTQNKWGFASLQETGLGAFSLESDIVIYRHYTAAGPFSCLFKDMFTGEVKKVEVK